ncbi:PhzF family phenazine biosynthesis protein [Polaribacter glomeratus]|uniref:PhzF family phenazine biosynthesis protein n=1 Tax=Polaribacter glomeratus TaxID=102 RepID=UPI0021CFA6CC|nr:PhzF family phenazine biosynthesis protein [Polaribacter glomeratus]
MDSSKKIVKVQILNAFAENGKGGNPAGVVLNANDLSNKDKLEISKKVGLSETAFVSKSKTEDFKLDFFTPNK